MFDSSGLLMPQPPPYNFDDALPPMTLEMYANNFCNDCVIAARAHHTIRLAWDGAHPLLSISDSDVTNEYARETGGPDKGLNLKDSLDDWKDEGWTIGNDRTMRKIKDYFGPYSIDGGAFQGSDPTMVLSQQQLRNRIFSDVCAQIDLSLPKGVSVNNSNSFGVGHPWQDTSDSEGDLHVVLLTGYSASGYLGISWAQRQEMTWGFLQKHCFGVFFVEKDETT
jgi:hypothetical protein